MLEILERIEAVDPAAGPMANRAETVAVLVAAGAAEIHRAGQASNRLTVPCEHMIGN